MTIKGGGAGGLTSNGKKHPKFPFWLFAPLPNGLALLLFESIDNLFVSFKSKHKSNINVFPSVSMEESLNVYI